MRECCQCASCAQINLKDSSMPISRSPAICWNCLHLYSWSWEQAMYQQIIYAPSVHSMKMRCKNCYSLFSEHGEYSRNDGLRLRSHDLRWFKQSVHRPPSLRFRIPVAFTFFVRSPCQTSVWQVTLCVVLWGLPGSPNKRNTEWAPGPALRGRGHRRSCQVHGRVGGEFLNITKTVSLKNWNVGGCIFQK